MKETPTARFRAIVALSQQALNDWDRQRVLSPGMQVQAEIKLGRRTVLEYLLSPVQRAWHEAGRER
jgi:HlyD family secretion protein